MHGHEKKMFVCVLDFFYIPLLKINNFLAVEVRQTKHNSLEKNKYHRKTFEILAASTFERLLYEAAIS